MNYDTPFFQVPRTSAETSQGPVELPILYGDVQVAYTFFRADTAAVTPLMAGTGLQEVPYSTSGCLVGVACYEYRDTTVGTYNEVGVVVPAVPAGEHVPMGGLPDLLRTRTRPEERRAGFHVLHLPVTTELANAGGRELWGYPKFVTAIDVALRDRSLACTVHDPDGPGTILRLEGSLGPGLRAPSLPLLTYSVLDDRLLRTTVDVRGGMRAHAGRGLRLDVGTSYHPMADTLRDLGLDEAAPALVLTSTSFQSRLNAGVAIGTVPARATV